MLRLLLRTATIAAFASLAPAVSLAHPGHAAANLSAGLLHPLSGLDHMLMIVAIGAWAALLPLRGRIIVASSLAALVGVGALLPMAGGAALEAAIALTVLGGGLLLAIGRAVPTSAAAGIAAAFALVHGFAHGAEGPRTSVAYVAGLMLTTGVSGFGVSMLVARMQARSLWWRAIGASGAAVGAAALLY